MGAPSLSRSVLTVETPAEKRRLRCPCRSHSQPRLLLGGLGLPALTWQVFTDDVGGFHRTSHGGMHNFIKLQPQACKSETSQLGLLTTLKVTQQRMCPLTPPCSLHKYLYRGSRDKMGRPSGGLGLTLEQRGASGLQQAHLRDNRSPSAPPGTRRRGAGPRVLRSGAPTCYGRSHFASAWPKTESSPHPS